MKTSKTFAAVAAILAVPVCAIAHPGHSLVGHNVLHVAGHFLPWLIVVAAAAYLVRRRVAARR